MLKDAGCSHVIVGHSERRQHYLENDHVVSQKTQAGLAAGLTVIVCVGETLEQRDQGKARDVVSEQIVDGLSGLTASDLDRIVVAYEPVWAIGTGRTASPEQAQDVHRLLRTRLSAADKGAADVLLLYGGSVKAANAKSLFGCPDIDGGLIGGASLKADEFLAIAGA